MSARGQLSPKAAPGQLRSFPDRFARPPRCCITPGLRTGAFTHDETSTFAADLGGTQHKWTKYLVLRRELAIVLGFFTLEPDGNFRNTITTLI